MDVQARHRLRFTREVLAPGHPLLGEILADIVGDEPPVRSAAFIDAGLAAARPQLAGQLQAALAAQDRWLQPVPPAHAVPGGEVAKNDSRILDAIRDTMHDAGLCRRSIVWAVGGGAVLDVVGYAAATAHRGVRLVRLPSTTLAQADSGVGVKNGVNAYGKKNYLGTFDVPAAVINDTALLTTLCERDWRSGFSEAVKVALIKDAGFFQRIVTATPAIAARCLDAAEPIIAEACRLHYDHIVDGGDPYERTIARPLDFGHWAAHKLEQMTAYDVRHGEAVAIGMAIDLLIAAECGRLDMAECSAALGCLRALGFALWHPALANEAELYGGLDEFREHLGGELAVPLVTRIGHAEVAERIERSALHAAVARLREDGQRSGQAVA